jgi:hypothetical protein
MMEAVMHALLIRVRVDSAHSEEATEQLHSTVVPRVKETPGVVSGYWISPEDGRGFSIILFENEEAAQAAARGIPNAPRPDYVTFDNIEVREVVASV